jgi:hypothetical protein
MVNRVCRFLAFGAYLGLGLAETWADPSSLMPQEGVLLLGNGELLHGRITQAGDRYIVSWGENGEVRVPRSEVVMAGRDVEEVYLRKRAAIDRAGATPHLDLAEWCLRHSLVAHAADELLDATALEPRHPRIAALERRWQLAASQPAPPGTPLSREPVTARPDDLERVLQSLPPVAVEDFAAHVQPLLLNRCGASTCHGSASSSRFQLTRPSWSKAVARRFTQRNLYAALQEIDRQAPEKSPLLTAPSGPHGGLNAAVLGDREHEQFARLEAWVKKATQQPGPAAPKTIASPQTRLLQTRFEQPESDSKPASTRRQPPAGKAEQPPSASSAAPAQPEISLPRDPFDPEIFNRRYGLGG